MPGKGSGKSKSNQDSRYSGNPRDPDNRDYEIETGVSDISDMYEKMTKPLGDEEYQKYKKAQELSFLSGLPIIGSFVKGMDEYRQIEDLYKNTGKSPAYPGLYGGSSTLSHAASSAAMFSANRIANGFHDLYQFYTGEPDSFRSIMNGMYG